LKIKELGKIEANFMIKNNQISYFDNCLKWLAFYDIFAII